MYFVTHKLHVSTMVEGDDHPLPGGVDVRPNTLEREEVQPRSRVYHPLPEGVNDPSREVRRRLTGKTPVGRGRESGTSPPPKRRKWQLFPGPSRGSQDNCHFPRVGVG